MKIRNLATPKVGNSCFLRGQYSKLAAATEAKIDPIANVGIDTKLAMGIISLID